MLVVVSPIKGIAHAFIRVNAVVSSHFLWITLGKSGLELLKRAWVLLFFTCLFGLLFLYFAVCVASLEYVGHMLKI